MKRKLEAPVVAAVLAALIVAMLFLSYLVSSGFYGAKSEPPPLSAPTGDAGAADGAADLYRIEGVEITRQNVQQVIKVLARSEGYSQTVTNTLYYDDESSTQNVVQYVRGVACRTDVLRGGSVAESYLRDAENFYAWQPGSGSSYFRGAAGDFTADSMAMLPNWQTVASLPAEEITSAGSVISGGEPVLLVTAESAERRVEYEISTVSGLLVAARYYEGSELSRDLRVTGISMEQPEDAHFTLPDGTSILP